MVHFRSCIHAGVMFYQPLCVVGMSIGEGCVMEIFFKSINIKKTKNTQCCFGHLFLQEVEKSSGVQSESPPPSLQVPSRCTVSSICKKQAGPDAASSTLTAVFRINVDCFNSPLRLFSLSPSMNGDAPHPGPSKSNYWFTHWNEHSACWWAAESSVIQKVKLRTQVHVV